MSTGAHTYRVGRDYFLDAAALQLLARHELVEPMGGGYQMLLGDAVVRLTHVTHAPLPEQSGWLYRCARADGREVGPTLRAVAGPLSAEWEDWPRNVALASACGCHAATASAAPSSCGCKMKSAAGEAPAADEDAPPTSEAFPAVDLNAAVLDLLDALNPGCLVRLQEHDGAPRHGWHGKPAFLVEVVQILADQIRRAGPNGHRSSNHPELAKDLLENLQQIVADSVDDFMWSP